MRVETTRTAGIVRLRHAVGFTASAEDVVARAGPLVAAAQARDEPVALAVRPATERALFPAAGSTAAGSTAAGSTAAGSTAAGSTAAGSTAAGSTAAGSTAAGSIAAGSTAAGPAGEPVLLGRPDGPDRSGQTLAARWARELRTLTSGRPGVTVIIEHDADHDGLDGTFWTELDAALNVALAEVAATVVCLYPQLPLHLEVAEGARRNHPLLLDGTVLRHNPAHRGPREVLADRGVPAPILLGPPDRRIGFDTWQLVEVRATVATAAWAAGCDRDRVEDLVLAVNEVATNAVEHGSGDAHLALWSGPGTRGLVCEVHDEGRLADPLPGLRAPHPSDLRGRGLWIARQLCDLLHVWADVAGTHVRIRALP